MIVEMPRFSGMMANCSSADVAAFVSEVAGAGYDPIAVGAVIENETNKTWSPAIAGAKAFSTPPGYAVGLLQFAPDTAKKLGTTTLAMKRMSFREQVKYVPRYYALFGGPDRFRRPVDYYLAGFGTGVGTADSYVLARKGEPAYERNKGLARGDDQITTGDLAAFVNGAIARARSAGTLSVNLAAPPQFATSGLPWPIPVSLGWFSFLGAAAAAAGAWWFYAR